MRRREFITLLGGAAAWPLAARAQQARLPIIGYLNAQAPAAVETARNKTAFQQGLREAGYIEGQNVVIEYRWAEGRYERLPALAAELTGRSVAVIAATGSDFSVRAAKAATTTIPIIFSTASDPVQSGFVASLNRPSGNVTGVTSLGVEVAPKRLQLLREVVPAANIFALLVNPINTNAETISRQTQAAAQTLGVQLHVDSARKLARKRARNRQRWILHHPDRATRRTTAPPRSSFHLCRARVCRSWRLDELW